MSSLTFLDLVNKGGVLVWPILFCSLLGTSIFLERYALYRRILRTESDHEPVFALLFAGRYQEAKSVLQAPARTHVVDRRILLEALNVTEPDRETLEMVLVHGVEREMSQLGKRLGTLAVLANVAPLLGLLGTVFGMIKAFMVVQDMGGSVNAAALAGGIWEAMLTTAFGLLAAIPLLFFHNHLEGKLNAIQADLEETAVTFMKAWAKGHNHRG